MRWYHIVTSPHNFVSLQVLFTLIHLPLTGANAMISLQLGNLYILFAAMFVLVCFVSTPAVTKAYLCLGAIADLVHIYESYDGIGSDLFRNIGRWSVMAWGTVGGSAFLLVNRIATIMDVCGEVVGFEGLTRD